MISSSDALRVLAEHKQELRSRFGIRDIALFGSVARDEAQPESDVDVLIDFEGAPTFDAYMGARFYLEELFQNRVDLVTPAGVRPELRSSVERDAIHVS